MLFILKNRLELTTLIKIKDSAGGSAVEGRDPKIQAIYYLKGKPLNTLDVNMNAVTNKDAKGHNKEIMDLVTCIGCGYGDKFDITKLKYGKVIIMADSDIDGYHISALLLTFFYKHMPQLIEQGHVYIAVSPLYRVKEGKEWVYIVDEVAYQKYINEKIVRTFNIKDLNKGKYLDGKAFNNFLKKSNPYMKSIKSFCNKFSIGKEIVEFIIVNSDDVSIGKINDTYKLLKSNIKEFNFITSKTDVNVEGYLDGEFYNFYINREFMKGLKEVYNNYHEIPNKVIEFEEDTNDYLTNMLDLMYKKCTPKDRNRLKGLGESDPEELWNTTMNPETRSLIQVAINDFDETGNLIETLMSIKADKKRDFMEENKYRAKDLDI
jgi:DNA gyrase subunit B